MTDLETVAAARNILMLHRDYRLDERATLMALDMLFLGVPQEPHRLIEHAILMADLFSKTQVTVKEVPMVIPPQPNDKNRKNPVYDVPPFEDVPKMETPKKAGPPAPDPKPITPNHPSPQRRKQ